MYRNILVVLVLLTPYSLAFSSTPSLQNLLSNENELIKKVKGYSGEIPTELHE